MSPWKPLGLALFLCTPTAQADAPDWVRLLNEIRRGSGLNPITEDLSLSQDAWLHARYTVKNGGALAHSETPGAPFYSDAGLASARSSNGSAMATAEAALADWMQAPFHAVGLLDPALERSGFGSFTEGGISSSWLDVIRGRGQNPLPSRAVMWPGDGSTVPYREYLREVPDPLASCAGYVAPSGLPLILQLPVGAQGDLDATKFTDASGVELEHCVFSWKTFRYPDLAWQKTGRAILEGRRAIVLIPRRSLNNGERYTAQIISNGVTYHWSFGITPR